MTTPETTIDEVIATAPTTRLVKQDAVCLAVNMNGPAGLTALSRADVCRARARWIRTRLEPTTNLDSLGPEAKVIGLVTSENSGIELPANPPTGVNDVKWNAYGEAFGAWARKIVLAHSSRLSAFEVLNEPNAAEQGALTPVASAIVIAKTYNAVRPLLPRDVPILLPATVGDWLTYEKQMLSALQQIQHELPEGAAIHPYNGGGDDPASPNAMIGKVRALFNVVKRPIWLTEFGHQTSWPVDDENENGAARILGRYYRALDDLRSVVPIGASCWFAWDDRTHWDPDKESWGIVARESEPEPFEDGLRRLRSRGCAFRNLTSPLCADDLDPPSCEGARYVVAGATPDFTGDSFADLVEHRISDGPFWVHENMKNGSFAPNGVNWGTGFTAASSDIDVFVADFTGDGFADYADHLRSDGTFWIHENMKNGTFAASGTNWGIGRTKGTGVLVGDFTGDGFADYADHDTVTGVFTIHENLKNGTFATAGWGSGKTGDRAHWDVLVGDFNGDGFTDYADRRRTDGRFFVHLNLKNGTFDPQVSSEGITSVGSDIEIVVGDFTGDKFADFADRRRSDGKMWIHENLRNGTFAPIGTNWGEADTSVGSDVEVLGSVRR